MSITIKDIAKKAGVSPSTVLVQLIIIILLVKKRKKKYVK